MIHLNDSIFAYLSWLKDRGDYLLPPSGQIIPPVTVAPPDEGTVPAPGTASAAAWASCFDCQLHSGRINPVMNTGSIRPSVLFLTDGRTLSGFNPAPLAEEESILLWKIAAAMNLTPEDVHIAPILRCPMPDNTLPEDQILAACRKHWLGLAGTLQPRVVITLGRLAARSVFGRGFDFGHSHGTFQELAELPSVKFLATLHPRDLLRYPANKRTLWMDVQPVMQYLRQESRHA